MRGEATHEEQDIATFRESSGRRPTEVEQMSVEYSESFSNTESDFPNNYSGAQRGAGSEVSGSEAA